MCGGYAGVALEFQGKSGPFEFLLFHRISSELVTLMVKIREIQIFAHELPVKNGPYTMAKADIWSVTTVLVALKGNNGLVGWGETCPLGATYAPAHTEGTISALKLMAPHLIGEDVLPQPLYAAMDNVLNGHNYAKSAIDIAAHDLLGKSLGVSVADLLGGALTDQMPSYFATGVGMPNEIAKIAKEKVNEGYPRIQVKVGRGDVAQSIETIHKVWEAIGKSEARIAVDANRGLNSRDAILLSQTCRNIPFVLEQPCDTIEEMVRIRPQLNHPLYIDESSVDLNTVITVAGTGLVDGFGMKVSRIGGLSKMHAFRDICAARHLPHTCDDSWGGNIIGAACAQIGSTVDPKLSEGVWLAAPYIEGNYDPKNPVQVEAGHVRRPTGPGLGVNPDIGIFGDPIAVF